MNITELKKKALAVTNERLQVQDLTIKPEVIADFVKDFGIKYFTKIGVDVTVETINANSTNRYFKSIEVKFSLFLKEINVGTMCSLVTSEYDETGNIRYMNVVFASGCNGITTASELADDIESAGNEALRKQFRKRMKKT